MIGTLSHEFITERITDAADTKVTIDKNGFLKVNFNAAAKLVLE